MYHVKELANFSNESVSKSAAAKTLDPVSRAADGRLPSKELAKSVPQQSKFVNYATSNRHEASGKQSHRASIVLPTDKPNDQDVRDASKFENILSWERLPAGFRMLQDQKNQFSQKASDLFRAMDKDGNAKLSSVEFFEGMTTKLGLSRDQVLHIMNIHKARQQGFYSFEEFEEILLALQTIEDSALHQNSALEPVDGDDDICVILDSPAVDQHHPNPVPLTRRNAGALNSIFMKLFCSSHVLVINLIFIFATAACHRLIALFFCIDDICPFVLTLFPEALRGKIDMIDNAMKLRHQNLGAQVP